jgi:hypothetical protein
VTSHDNRDLIAYGSNPPDPTWPDDARVAVNVVMNHEEGSEPSVRVTRKRRSRKHTA